MADLENSLYGHQHNASDATLASSPLNSGFKRASSSNDEEVPAVIPPKHAGRTLVMCFDGTGDQ